MLNVGLVGWRGMVGSVLLERMSQENDWEGLEATFFSTSQSGEPAPEVGASGPDRLLDAYDVESLSRRRVIVSCQGSDYTKRVYPELRNAGWNGYWIDASSALRMEDESIIVLDPVNRPAIDDSLRSGGATLIGGNCTVSLMLMALAGLLREDLIEWISTMTYQAASGAGARQMRELIAQMRLLGGAAGPDLDDPASQVLAIDRSVQAALVGSEYPRAEIGAQLAGSLIPWIDSAVDGGQTREEWKGYAESNKILGRTSNPLPVDGICVRVGAMRSHSQGLTIKLRSEVPLDEIETMIGEGTPWTEFVANEKQATIERLTPAAVSGTLRVPVGRVHTMRMGPEYLTLFTVGDQLLWGAAEPIRRALSVVREYLE